MSGADESDSSAGSEPSLYAGPHCRPTGIHKYITLLFSIRIDIIRKRIVLAHLKVTIWRKKVGTGALDKLILINVKTIVGHR